jgi:glycosyltransferase involved in cell wall biosynthesis
MTVTERNLARMSGDSAGGRHSRPSDLRVGFVMSTEVGLRTQFLNWKACLTPDLGIDPEWIIIDWWKHGGLIERLPLVPATIKARVRAEIQLRGGLRTGPFDALFVAQERMFHGTNSALFRQPFFITADVTAEQLAAFGSLYSKESWGPVAWEQYKHRERRERLRRARALFPWSQWAAESMVTDYDADPSMIHVIPPGVDMAKWRMADRIADRKGSGPVNILFVGGDFIRKGGDLLLDWAAKTTRRDWRLHIVTRDFFVPTHPAVRVYNRLQPNEPALLGLYANAHMFALPTRGDCYSLAGIEAMAAGLPVILSKTGGTGDIVRDDQTGFLIPPGDGPALAERLDYLLDNPDRRALMGCAARQDAEARYDAKKNVQAIVQHMRDHLGR